MEDESSYPSPVSVRNARPKSEEGVADHQRVCVIQTPKQRIEGPIDDERNSSYYCRRGPVLSENSINNILKVVSLQSFSNPRLHQNNETVITLQPSQDLQSRSRSNSPISNVRSSGESSPSSEETTFNPPPEIQRNAAPKKPSSRKRGEKVMSTLKDEKYWEKRLRNNASAKRSRDARRVRELECQIRSEFMEDENRKLEEENRILKEENLRLLKIISEMKSRS